MTMTPEQREQIARQGQTWVAEYQHIPEQIETCKKAGIPDSMEWSQAVIMAEVIIKKRQAAPVDVPVAAEDETAPEEIESRANAATGPPDLRCKYAAEVSSHGGTFKSGPLAKATRKETNTTREIQKQASFKHRYGVTASLLSAGPHGVYLSYGAWSRNDNFLGRFSTLDEARAIAHALDDIEAAQ